MCCVHWVRSEKSQLSKRSPRTSCLIHTKPLFKQDNNIPQISFSCHQRPSSPHTQESMEEKGENPKNRRWGFLKNIRHLRAVEDDTRHRVVTQWAMYSSGCVCHGRPIPSTKTHSTTVCMGRQSHVTGDGRVPQAGTLITLIDLRCGFTEPNPAWNWICWLGSVRITFH